MTTEASESSVSEQEQKPAAPVAKADEPAKPNASQSNEEPDWLPKRLEQASRSAVNATLAGLGFDSEESAKAALAELKALRESQMSEQEKIQARLAELEPAAQRAAALEGTVKAWAERAVASLTESQRNAVQALTGGEPSKVLGAIEALKPTWESASAPVVQPPKDTATPGGPPDTPSSSESDIYSQFQTSKNPFRRASIVREYAPQLIKR